MKILKLFTNWLNKTGKGSRKTNKARQEFKWMKIERKERIARDSANRAIDKMKHNTTYGQSTKVFSNHSLSGAGISSGGVSAIANANSTKSAIVIDSNNNKVTIEAAVEINKRDILKELDEMRDALLLLKRDVDMEAKYPKLRELKDQYENQLAKYKTFDALRKTK